MVITSLSSITKSYRGVLCSQSAFNNDSSHRSSEDGVMRSNTVVTVDTTLTASLARCMQKERSVKRVHTLRLTSPCVELYLCGTSVLLFADVLSHVIHFRHNIYPTYRANTKRNNILTIIPAIRKKTATWPNRKRSTISSHLGLF